MQMTKISRWLALSILGLAFKGGTAEAAPQFRAVTKESTALYAGPGDRYPMLKEAALVEKEVVIVLGNSTGGIWLNVMKKDGTEAWVPKNKLDLYRISDFELDELGEVLEMKRRITSSWIVDMGVHLSSSPHALGVAAMVWGVPFRNGLMARKIDQLEIGAGFIYGMRVTSNTSARNYSEMPIAAQWMFRMPPRGALMAGPKVGVALLQDKSISNKYSLLAGATMRFYPYDSFGFYLELFVVQKGGAYITRQAGISFRF